VLWQWADDNRIQAYQLPRNRDGLLNLTQLNLGHNQLTELPKEQQEWFDNIEEACI
jgi:Leucine-rich repeat (LRR) protein